MLTHSLLVFHAAITVVGLLYLTAPIECQLAGLTNYWKFNGNLVDSIGVASLSNPINVSYVKDRLGKTSSALYLNYGYAKFPSNVYFNGSDYTLAAWIKPLTNDFSSCFLDCGTATQGQNDVIIGLSFLTTGKPYLEVDAKSVRSSLTAITKLSNTAWSFIAFTQRKNAASLYINGVIDASSTTLNVPQNVNRTQCYLGKSFNKSSSQPNVYVDDLMLFNRALSANELTNLMLYNSTSPVTSSTSTTTKTSAKTTSSSGSTKPANTSVVTQTSKTSVTTRLTSSTQKQTSASTSKTAMSLTTQKPFSNQLLEQLAKLAEILMLARPILMEKRERLMDLANYLILVLQQLVEQLPSWNSAVGALKSQLDTLIVENVAFNETITQLIEQVQVLMDAVQNALDHTNNISDLFMQTNITQSLIDLFNSRSDEIQQTLDQLSAIQQKLNPVVQFFQILPQNIKTLLSNLAETEPSYLSTLSQISDTLAAIQQQIQQTVELIIQSFNL